MFKAGKTANFICRHCRARFRQQLGLTSVSPLRPSNRAYATFEKSIDANSTHKVAISPLEKKNIKNAAVFYPLGKIRGTPGKSVREKSANLETHSLGRPSEVIILHDVTDDGQEKASEVIINEAKSLRTLDSKEIVASIEAEKTQLGLEDAVQEIDRLRQSNNLSQKVFEEMRIQLRDGYTIPQLRNYIAVKAPELAKKKVLSSSSIKRNNTLSSPIDRKGVRSLWLADTKPIEERMPYKDTEKSRLLAYKRSSKTKLADLIILGCWKVEIEDDVEAFGQIEIKLRPWQTNLLLSGDPSILDQIRDRRNVRIDVWRLSVIRVSGYKRSAEETLNDIDSELLAIDEVEFDTSPFMASRHGYDETLFSEEQIGIIARLTQSVISQFPGKNKICIRALERHKAENAHRFLLYLLRLPSFSRSTIQIDEGLSRKSVIQASSEFFLGSKAFGASKALYGRLVSPVSKKGLLHNRACDDRVPTGLTEASKSKTYSQLNELLNSRAAAAGESPSKGSLNWENCPGTEVFAMIGQLLHSVTGKRAYQKHDPQKLILKPDVDRFFVDAISNFRNFLSYADLEEIFQEKPKLFCFFAPCPWTEIGTEALKVYPRVAMCFGENLEGSDFDLLNLFAINDDVRADLMLPQYRFDIRFLRQTVLKLNGCGLKDPEIDSYASLVQSMALNGAQIQAPLQLNLRVPLRPGFHGLSNTKLDSAKNGLIPYRLSSIEHHQRTSATTGPLKLSYTAIEGGQVQGSFGEFKLHMPSDTENFSTTDFIDESLHVLKMIQDGVRTVKPNM